MELETLKPARGAVKDRKRVGRGPGSGRGKTAARGSKGQKSRSGYSRRVGFEGGQMPLVRRVPKRGFKNPFRVEHACINIKDLVRRFQAGDTVSPDTLREKGLVKKMLGGLKVLGEGEIDHALTVRAHAFTEAARAKIEKAGGRCEVIER